MSKALPVIFAAAMLAVPATASALSPNTSAGSSFTPAAAEALGPNAGEASVLYSVEVRASGSDQATKAIEASGLQQAFGAKQKSSSASRPEVVWLSVSGNSEGVGAAAAIGAQNDPQATSGEEVIITITVGEKSYDIKKSDADKAIATARERKLVGADVLERFFKSIETGEEVSEADLLTIDAVGLAEIDASISEMVTDLQAAITKAAEERAAAEQEAAEQGQEGDGEQGTSSDDPSEEGTEGDNKSTDKATDTKDKTSDKESKQASSAPLQDTEPAGPQTSGNATTDEIVSYTPNPTTTEFIASIGEQSRKMAGDNDLYASVMIAQAVLESGSGSSGLAKAPNYNLFGIKGSYNGSSVSMRTQEEDDSGRIYTITAQFRKYPSTTESLQDYVDLLTKTNAAYYAPARKSNAKTYVEACDYLQGHYATSTSYSRSLQGLITTYDLTQYDKPTPEVKKAEVPKVKSKTLKFVAKKADGRQIVASAGDGPIGSALVSDADRSAISSFNLVALAIYLPVAALAIAALLRFCSKE